MIYLIRHGRTEYNAEGRLQGQLDSPLVPMGVQPAERYGAALRAIIGDAGDWSHAAPTRCSGL